jgi:tRNA A-37 threonylcarbamoyl transferase component Bud32
LIPNLKLGADKMAGKKINCWEYMKCGRQLEGNKVAEFGVCPAAIDESYDGIHDGKMAGRICWAVAGTCCGNDIQGTYAQKRKSCISCPFYKKVQEQEGTSETACKLIELFTENGNSRFLDMMTCMKVKAGERLATQGEIRDTTYIIQRGSCIELVEKNGVMHPAGHRCRGDLIGITSVLTGEPQRAHIEAETDMELWVISRKFFDRITQEDHDLLEFLTEVVASRFNSKRPISDRQIGKYVATDIIGNGAFSIVYRGYHSGLNMPVAIKMMKHDIALHPDFQSSFLNEARTIAKLSHENIVTIYDIEERFKTVFIVQEYLEGSSLRDMLNIVKRISPKLTVHYLMQICRGLQYAHEHRIAHQDIKPGNIFILANDKIRILDFGLAAPFGSEGYLSGSPYYMAPEQVECLPVDSRTDIYTLGLTVYEMLTGEKPFYADDKWEMMQMRLTRDIQDPAEILPELPEILRRFILKACARLPADRYTAIEHVLQDLEPLAKEYGITGESRQSEKQNISTIFLISGDGHLSAFKHLMDDFSLKAKKMGIKMKIADIQTE